MGSCEVWVTAETAGKTAASCSDGILHHA